MLPGGQMLPGGGQMLPGSGQMLPGGGQLLPGSGYPDMQENIYANVDPEQQYLNRTSR